MSRTEPEVNFDPEGKGGADYVGEALDALAGGETAVAQVLALVGIAEAVADVAGLLDVLVGEGTEDRLSVDTDGDEASMPVLKLGGSEDE